MTSWWDISWSPGNDILSVEAWAMWENGSDVQLAALGIMMTFGLGVHSGQRLT